MQLPNKKVVKTLLTITNKAYNEQDRVTQLSIQSHYRDEKYKAKAVQRRIEIAEALRFLDELLDAIQEEALSE